MTDERLENMLSKSMPQIAPGTELNERILGEMREKRISRFHGKKAVVLAVACMLMLSSLTVVAATVGHYIVTHTTDFRTKDYRKIAYAEEQMGCDLKFIRNFASGFSFDEMYMVDNHLHSVEESGEMIPMEDFPSIFLYYSGEKGDVILSCMKDERESLDTEGGVVRDISGVNVVCQNFAFDRDKEISVEITSVEGQSKDAYTLSQEYMHHTVQWIQDGVYYYLGSMPGVTTEEELISMAEELIISE